MKCDIVLINEAVSPPICKAFNYKDHLYKQFVKQIGNISAQRKSIYFKIFFNHFNFYKKSENPQLPKQLLSEPESLSMI